MADWKLFPLKSLATKITKGSTPTTLGRRFVDSGINFIKSESIGYDGVIDESKFAFIDCKTHDMLKRSQIVSGDILYSIAGVHLGKCASAKPTHVPAKTNQAVAIIRIDESKANSKFIEFFLRNQLFVHQVLSGVAQSAQPNVNLTDIGTFRISLPRRAEQEAIAEILTALDDKIDLNGRMNETLELTARAIFRDWIVDFGPTRAKMEGREPYLQPELWALFPDRLDAHGKPEGWQGKPLDQIANFLNGLALQKYPPDGEDDLPVIKIAELRAGTTERSGRASRSIPPQYVIEDGDVLFSWSGSLMHDIWTGGRGALNQHLFKVTSHRYPKWFYYFWIGDHMPEFRSIAASKVTTMGHIQRQHLSAAETIVPSDAVLKSADEFISPLFELTIANRLEARILAQTRDLILPKLMSGEIRVRDTEKLIGAVT